MGDPDYVMKQPGHDSDIITRLLVILMILMFSSPVLLAHTDVWQWSLPMGQGRAFLWIPSDCQQVRGVVVGQNNTIEQGILEHEIFRATLKSLGFASVFIAPPFDVVFQFDQGAGERFDELMSQLAEVSGYTELALAPVIPLGHSACASYPWNFAAWNPDRTLAVLSVHGDAPLTNYTGSGRPNPNWGQRLLDGVPGLMVMAEYEWGDDQFGVDRLSPALNYRNEHPQTPLALLAEPGEGHFNSSDRLVDFLAMFIRKAAEVRLPSKMSLDRLPVLKPVDPKKGWLVQRWYLNQPRTVEPAPWSDYKGDPRQAFWAFDEEMAWAIQNYHADQPGKKPQLLSITQAGMALAEGCGEPVNLPFVTEADGVTFHLNTSFMAMVPGDEQHNTNAARWAYLPAGSPLGHATDGGPIVLQRIVGPVKQTGPNTFVYCMNRLNSTDDRRRFDIWLWASHPGDAQYKRMVQQAHIRVENNRDGKGQVVQFPAISNQTVDTKSIKLSATSNVGLQVYYYVLEGPAVINDDLLMFTQIPPRTRYPVKVTVVAWQQGVPDDVRTADPVTQQFFITQ